jgi:hypothetical protein
MLRHAFKEWAVICRALAEGKQALILRKGGVAEAGGQFVLEHTRFWLYPTYVHQQHGGIVPAALPLLEQVEAERPPAGTVRLTHFVEVAGIYHVHDLVPVLLLGHHYLWSEQTVRARFACREPGLYVLAARVYQAAEVFDLPVTPADEGCRTWVELDRGLSTDEAKPVLDDAAFRDLLRTLDGFLNPTALA